MHFCGEQEHQSRGVCARLFGYRRGDPIDGHTNTDRAEARRRPTMALGYDVSMKLVRSRYRSRSC